MEDASHELEKRAMGEIEGKRSVYLISYHPIVDKDLMTLPNVTSCIHSRQSNLCAATSASRDLPVIVVTDLFASSAQADQADETSIAHPIVLFPLPSLFADR